MPVDTLHPLYAAHQRRAQRVRDAVAGTDAVKDRGTEYLPDPSGPRELMSEAEKKEAEQRYSAYKKRALWLGVTGRTHEGMLGAVFRKNPAIKLPSALEYIQQDADGSGMSLTQFGRMVTSALIQSGRHGILVDYPEAEDGLTREQTAGLRANLRSYDSESIINWDVSGDELVLVVLQEHYDTGIDEFDPEIEIQHRVLRLQDGVYTVQVYRDNNPVGEPFAPRMANGQTLDRIPFQFVGAVNNDETPDKPVLLDMADVNLAHYRNSADLEECGFIISQPMLHVDIGDMTTDEWKQLNPNGIRVGSRQGIQTKGGKIDMVQAEERNLLMSLMEHKEKQMLSIGARLIDQKGGNETAESVRARSGAENSSLNSVAENGSDAMENCLEWLAGFMIANPDPAVADIEYRLNTEFYEQTADPQEVMARIQEVDRGLIALSDYRDWRRRTGGIAANRTDEEIDDEVQTGGTNIGAL